MSKHSLTLAILAVAAVSTASAADFHVADWADCPGAGTAAAPFCSIDSCNDVVQPGDRCVVQPGSYVGRVRPNTSGTTAGRVTYECPSRQCELTASTVYSVDLRDKSHVTVSGFTLTGEGTAARLSGTQSTGILVEHIRAEGVYFQTKGGTGTVVRHFDIRHGSTTQTVFKLAHSYNNEYGTLLQHGTIRGGVSNLLVGTCHGCTVDDVRLGGGWAQSLELDGATDFTIKNSILLATGKDGAEGPLVKQVDGLTIVNNAISRGWKLPSPGYACGLRGTIVVKNNIFNNAGRRDDSASAKLYGQGSCSPAPANWPPQLEIDFNAYVGAGNFVDDGSTPMDDTAAFWRDHNQPDGYYYPDSDPNLADWRLDTGLDQASAIIDNTDFRAPSSTTAETCGLWSTSGPFWGGAVRCANDVTSVETNLRWRDGIATGDRIAFADGVLRTVTTIGAGSGNPLDGCEYRVSFTPALPAPAEPETWFDVYPALGVGLAGDSFFPRRDSAVVDAGDDAWCGHPIVGAGCDIGPAEFFDGALEGSWIEFGTDATTIDWVGLTEADRYHVYRGRIADLRDANGDGAPDSGYGSCLDTNDPNMTDTTHPIAGTPQPGEGFFYVISHETTGIESGLGATSTGVDRVPSSQSGCL